MSTAERPESLPPPLREPIPVLTKAKPIQDSPKLERVYVWDLVVRLTHWTIVLSIGLLALTGIYIGAPFLQISGDEGRFFMGGVRLVHEYTAIAFICAVLARLIWMFTGSRYARWWNFLPIGKKARELRRGITGTLSFYLFLRKRPPEFTGHNPVAGLAYAAVFGLYVVMIWTGIALYAPSASVVSPLASLEWMADPLGGLQNTRWVHHGVMWLLLGFAVQHIYSSVLVSVVERNGTLDSIFSGWKWLRKHEGEK